MPDQPPEIPRFMDIAADTYRVTPTEPLLPAARGTSARVPGARVLKTRAPKAGTPHAGGNTPRSPNRVLKGGSGADQTHSWVEDPAPEAPPTQAVRLHDLWYESWRAIGASGDGQAALEQLLSVHHDPARYVHNAQQLLDCFSSLNHWRSHTSNFHQVALAIWFHDAFLDPTRHDNEARSARLASQYLTSAGVCADVVRRIRDLIIATRPGEQLSSVDACLIHDIDRVVFSGSDASYDRYERNLRYENSHLVDFIYRRKRIEQLQSLLGRAPIYASEVGQLECHFAAEANLRRWLQIWQQTDSPIPQRASNEGGLIHPI